MKTTSEINQLTEGIKGSSIEESTEIQKIQSKINELKAKQRQNNVITKNDFLSMLQIFVEEYPNNDIYTNEDQRQNSFTPYAVSKDDHKIIKEALQRYKFL